MALILNIDTATESGSVCLAKDGLPLVSRKMELQRDHAALTIPLIKEILAEQSLSGQGLQAVAISAGPGSYTGLRVAAATAKGLCYALDIPLIAISTLKMMAAGARRDGGGEQLYCPVIDARRMDVFTALYDASLKILAAPAFVTLDASFMEDYRDRPVVIFGTGGDKATRLFDKITAWSFRDFKSDAVYLAPLAEDSFHQRQFEDPAYFTPFYLKSFYTAKPPK